ncbi:MAG: PAS domain S-box protein [Holophagaceae bacterium]|nr:PAS domain S-box protein [Holophagaceae bacterium]
MLTDGTLVMILALRSLLGGFLCVLFWSMYRPNREQRYFLWWSLAWSAHAGFLVLGLAATLVMPGGLARSGLQLAAIFMAFLQLPLLILGVRAFIQPETGRFTRAKVMVVAIWCLLGLTVYLVSKSLSGSPDVSYQIRTLPRQLAMAGAYAFCAHAMWRAWRMERTLATALCGSAFALMVGIEARFVLAGGNFLANQAWGVRILFPVSHGQELSWALFNAGSTLLLALGMVQLLVERTQSIGDRLKASEALFSSAFRAIPDAVSLTRVVDDTFVHVSEGFTRITGWSASEALGRQSRDLVLWADEQEARRLQETIGQQGECTGLEATFRRKDGRTFTGMISARVLHLEGRELQVTILRDITVRKERELSLRKASRVMEQSPLVVMITDLKGDLEYVNPAFTTATGYQPDEVLGRNPRFLKSGETLPATYQRLWRTLTSGGTWEGEFCNRRKDGSHYWERGRISPIYDDSGQITHYVAVKEDITAVREMELERRNLDRQSQVNQRIEAVGQLAGGVAHDINNMLSIMLAHIDLLSGQVPDTPSVQKRLKDMEEAALRSAEIVRSLLTFARQQVTEPKILDLNAHLEGLRRTLAPLLGEDQVLKPRLDPALWRVKVDPAQWDQVVMNLVLNARDAMPRGGEIALDTCNLDLDDAFAAAHPEATPGPHVCLSVGDQGEGMTTDQMARIFEPFYTTKPLGKGTGLGLSTVYGIVKQAGGFLTVYSEPGVGSTFKVYLPAAEGERPAAVAPLSEEAPPASGRILVVEDNELLRACIQDVVSRLGYETQTVDCPEQALALLGDPSLELDLLLTDVIMPGMSGKELRDRALVLRPGLPVLYMSGYTADIIARKGVLEAGTDFLQKPFTREAIRMKIRQVMEGR